MKDNKSLYSSGEQELVHGNSESKQKDADSWTSALVHFPFQGVFFLSQIPGTRVVSSTTKELHQAQILPELSEYVEGNAP